MIERLPTSEIPVDKNVYGIQAPDFKQVDSYTTFRAEHATLGLDLVVHFFVTQEIRDSLKNKAYWLQVFPTTLSGVTAAHFGIDPRRLRIAYTEELASWWLKVAGVGDRLEIEASTLALFEKLDQALEATNSM